MQACGTGKGFDVAFDDVRGVRRGRALRLRFAGMSAGRREFAGTRDRERGHGSQNEIGTRGVAALFDEMVAVAVQAMLSSV